LITDRHIVSISCRAASLESSDSQTRSPSHRHATNAYTTPVSACDELRRLDASSSNVAAREAQHTSWSQSALSKSRHQQCEQQRRRFSQQHLASSSLSLPSTTTTTQSISNSNGSTSLIPFSSPSRLASASTTLHHPNTCRHWQSRPNTSHRRPKSIPLASLRHLQRP
jgi:hypothetical protein